MSNSAIYFHFEEVEIDNFQAEKLTNWITSTIKNEEKEPGEINYIFCSDEYLLNINQQYLNHDTFTDIVTFNYVNNNIISGDLFISYERILENAKQFSVTELHELKRVMVHGILHLIGYNDKTAEEAQEIRAKEDFYLTLSADL
jgi:rRNA maturation RNase YbeY